MVPRKLTHLQARAEQRLYWSKMSIADRLAAATALTKRSYSMLGIDPDELKPDERKAGFTLAAACCCRQSNTLVRGVAVNALAC